jgi:hypothetical protein
VKNSAVLTDVIINTSFFYAFVGFSNFKFYLGGVKRHGRPEMLAARVRSENVQNLLHKIPGVYGGFLGLIFRLAVVGKTVVLEWMYPVNELSKSHFLVEFETLGQAKAF